MYRKKTIIYSEPILLQASHAKSDIVAVGLLSYRVIGAIHSIKTTGRVYDDVTIGVFEDAEHVGRVVDLYRDET